MNQTERVPLLRGSVIPIREMDGGVSEWVVDAVIGYGGSCIVYRAAQKTGPFSGRRGIIKELYPQSLSGIRREGNALLIPAEEQQLFERKRERFEKGFSFREKHGALDKDHAMTLPRVYGEANNTWYAVSDENTGGTLLEIDRRDLTLNRVAQITDSLCTAISALHENGYLYLDCKPDNINAYTLDRRDHIRLFDFDTVQAKRTLHKAEYSSYSDGWAPPEQKSWRVADISERTDIYSLGAVFFWLLTGRKPTGDTFSGEDDENDINEIRRHTFDWSGLPLCADASDSTVSLLQRICGKTLTVPSERYDSAAKMQIDVRELLDKTCGNPAVEKAVIQAKTEISDALSEGLQHISKQITDLQNALPLPDPDSVIASRNIAPIRNRFFYDAENVSCIGRESELNYLVKMCEGSDLRFCWLGIYGSGGSGKTRIAFELCKKMTADGWYVVWPSHIRSNIEQIKKDLCSDHRDALICFDDVITDIDMAVDFIQWCAENPHIASRKVRLLLLERDFGDLLEESYICCLYHDASCGRQSFMDADGLMKVSACSPESIASILSSYAENVYNKTPEQTTLEFLCEKVREIDRETRPLFALFVADAWCNGEDLSKWDRTDALEMVITKENEKAIHYIKLEQEKKSERSKLLNAYKTAVVCASFLTRVDGCDLDLVGSVFEKLYHARIDKDSAAWLFSQTGLLEDDDYSLKKPFPDLICEYYSIRYINSLSRNQAVALACELLSKDAFGTVAFGNSIWENYDDYLIAPANISIFQYIAEKTDERIGERLSEDIGQEALDQFDRLTDDQAMAEWMDLHKPNYRHITHQVLQEARDYFLRNLGTAFTSKKEVLEAYTYEGEYLLTWRCGRGRIEYPDHTVYEGEWNKDQINGYGTMTWPDGTRYSGDWISGKKNGQGTMVFSNKNKYAGHWLDDFRDGRGVMSFRNGAVFDGEWQQGTMLRGKMTYPNSLCYEGEFSDGVPNGSGKMTFRSGSVYTGMWKNGKRCGPGRMVFSDGRVCEGEWENDSLLE